MIGSCFGLCRCIFELKPSLIIESIEPEHIRVPSNDHGIVSERTRDTFFAESAKFRVLNQRPFGQCATAYHDSSGFLLLGQGVGVVSGGVASANASGEAP